MLIGQCAMRKKQIQSTLSIVTPLGTKKNGVIIKILYDVTKERFFLISLLVTWANAIVLIGRDVTISGVTIKGDDCIRKKKISHYSTINYTIPKIPPFSKFNSGKSFCIIVIDCSIIFL